MILFVWRKLHDRNLRHLGQWQTQSTPWSQPARLQTLIPEKRKSYLKKKLIDFIKLYIVQYLVALLKKFGIVVIYVRYAQMNKQL